MSLDQLLLAMADPSELSWKDETYDLALAGGLPAAERATLVASLLAQAQHGDTRAILTLGHLNATEALPLLSAAAKSSEPWAATARRALVLLGRGADVIAEIANDATQSPAKMARVAAVMDLPKIGGGMALAALQAALTDEDSDVRVIAWDALVHALGLAKRIQNPEGVRQLTTEIEVMRVLLASEITALVKLGASGMRETARRLAAGATPQQLGIAWRPKQAEAVFDKLREAMEAPGAAYPVKEIATLHGPARQLAETMIVRRLEEGDARVPTALVALDAAWTAPALEEIANSSATPSELRVALAHAARELTTT
jgi:hypothetical protein